MMDSFIAVSTIILLFLATYLFYPRRPASYPPGPKPLPFIGNLLDLPQSQEWLTYAAWAKKWGNVIMVSALGNNIVIINDGKVASDLLEGQNNATSNRPYIAMASIAGWARTFVLMNADKGHKLERKMSHKIMGTPTLAANYDYVQEEEWQKSLQRILSSGKGGDLKEHIQAAISAVILRIGYGYRINDTADEYITLVRRVMDAFGYGSQPNTFFVNLFPAIHRLPNWFPGTGYRKIADQWAREFSEYVDIPFKFVKDQMSKGIGERSMMVRLLEEPGDEENWEEHAKYMMAAMYGGGADTSVAGVYALYKAMILYPEVQRKAQAEIDRVTGGLRLPTLKDRPNMPYVNALVSEVLRWHPIAPLAVPHSASEDVHFNGYTLPKGSLIVPNIWAISRNSTSYPDPEKFDPSRFLPEEGKVPQLDPRTYVFGYGRRICPGRYLALNTIFIAIAMSLAVFEILPAHDEKGKPIIPDTETLTGVISHPSSFDYEIKPRSKGSAELIANYTH